MHLWMETYFFCCSVRLGMIVIAVMTLLQLIVGAILNISVGVAALDPVIKLFRNDDVYSENNFVKKILDWMENSPTNFMLVVNIYILIFGIICILAIYGAIKLLKWFIMPFIIIDLICVIFTLTLHIILMIVLKKLINLGLLIALTLIGGFFILFLGYNWAASVALYQIINLVHSERYRALYGEDPFASPPTPPPSYASLQHPYGTIKNVRVLVTPKANDIDDQKQMNDAVKFKWKRPIAMQQPIIAVIPVNSKYIGGIMPMIIDHNNSNSNRLLQEQHQDYYNDNIGYNSDYENWQWTELVGGQKHRQQRSYLIGQN